MTFEEFQIFVNENVSCVVGVHNETAASLTEAEQRLGHTLPPSMRWLLSEYGYSGACGLDSLADVVDLTLQARSNCGLDHRYILMNDWQDGGAVFMDASLRDAAGEYPIYWVGSHNFASLLDGEPMDEDLDVFPNYPAWVQYRLQGEKEQNL